MKYECLETFSIPCLEQRDEGDEGEFKVIKGSFWQNEQPVEENPEIELVGEGGSWLIIPKELFELMFEEVEE